MTSALDIEQPEALRGYLITQGHMGSEEQPEIRVLAGGVSNRTVLVRRTSGEAWVLKQALAKLRVAVDWYSDPQRIHREALGLRWLSDIAPGRIPTLVFEDCDEHLLAMEAVPEPHVNWKSLLLTGEVRTEQVEQFGRLLGTIHRAGHMRRVEAASVFADQSFFESLRLEPYYLYTATQVPEAADFLQNLVTETRARRFTIVHGDYSPKNILIHSGQLVLLDHEVIHFGDPAFDLGFSLTHLLSKAHHLPVRRAAFGEAADFYWQVYRETLGDVPWSADLETYAVRHTLGCLLARVAGRSPLEYLSPSERARQRAAVVALLQAPPSSVPALIQEFLVQLE